MNDTLRYRELWRAGMNVVEFAADVDHLLAKDPHFADLRQQVKDLGLTMNEHYHEEHGTKPENSAKRGSGAIVHPEPETAPAPSPGVLREASVEARCVGCGKAYSIPAWMADYACFRCFECSR